MPDLTAVEAMFVLLSLSGDGVYLYGLSLATKGGASWSPFVDVPFDRVILV